MPEADRPEFLARHMIPVLLGPKKRFYVIDHHHLARALLDEGCETVQVNVVADLRRRRKARRFRPDSANRRGDD